jgi:transglutaminase-like putative cysteine protease
MTAGVRDPASPAAKSASPTAQRAARVLRVQHETRYDYGEPVELAHHMAHLRPRETHWQRVRGWSLHISPWPDGVASATLNPLESSAEAASADDTDGSIGGVDGIDAQNASPCSPCSSEKLAGADPSPGVHQSRDPWGNWRAVFSHSRVHRRLVVQACFTVELFAQPPLQLQASPPWELVAKRLRYQPGRPFDAALEFVLPSFYAPRDNALARLGGEAFVPGAPLLAGAVALMHLIHRRFEYRPTTTSVTTRAIEALALRRGVCQDFAHVMIGALRSLGLAARYVSGYLLTQPPPGQPRLVGADASHAWVAVWCPVNGWVALDPTNAVPAGHDHVTLAWGRDYADVAPLRGVIRGGAQVEPRVSVTVEPLDEAAASAS